MRTATTPRLKVCCIMDDHEARLAVERGAAALGLVSEMPSGPGVIPEPLITSIAATVPPGVATFLLTSKRTAFDIVAQQRRTRVNTIQICDALPQVELAQLRAQLPGISLVQVIHVLDMTAISEAMTVAPFVDAILLDSGNPRLAVKELGGTGRRHDWTISRHIRDAIDRPVWLAGGLRPENVREAIDLVRPFGLDVCSGVRTDGRLDRSKLDALIAGIK